MRKHILINEYNDWWAEEQWNWFASLTFRGSPSFSTADHRLYEWIEEIESEAGNHNFRWIRILDRRGDSDHPHFYVLVGGLRSGSKHYWVYRWNELAGDTVISFTSSSSEAARQLANNLSPDGDFAVQYKLGLAAPAWVA